LGNIIIGHSYLLDEFRLYIFMSTFGIKVESRMSNVKCRTDGDSFVPEVREKAAYTS
jgi:hypothetical protein